MSIVHGASFVGRIYSEIIVKLSALSKKDFLDFYDRQESENNKKRVLIARMATDVELFSKKYFPHYCKYPFNNFHKKLFSRYTEKYNERGLRAAWAAPRGYAKSTIACFIKLLHDACYGYENFIVIFSNTMVQSNQKIFEILTEFLTNKDLINDFGIRFDTKKPGRTEFVVHTANGSCKFMAFGAGSEVRGLKYGHYRPSKIVLDDIEHSEEVFNERLRIKMFDWLMQVVANLGDTSTNIELVGTILHRDSLLMNLTKNPAYESELFSAVLNWPERTDLWDKFSKIYTDLESEARSIEADNFFEENKDDMLQGVEVLWPQKEPFLYLYKELIEKGKRAFFKEKQGSPLGAEEKVFDKIHYYDFVEGRLILESGTEFLFSELQHKSFGVIDPSSGGGKAGQLSDYTAIVSGFLSPDNRVLIHDVVFRRMPPTEIVRKVFDLNNYFHYQNFGVEKNHFSGLLIENLEAERERRQQEIGEVIPLYFLPLHNTENKERRIFSIEPRVTHGQVIFNRAISPEILNTLEDFPHADSDDFPDALEMLIRVTTKVEHRDIFS